MSSESEPMEMTSGDYSAVSQTYPPPVPTEPEAAPILSAEPATPSEESIMPSAEVRRAKRGKAPMDYEGPKRKRGRPRKRCTDAVGASTSRPPSPPKVTLDHFNKVVWEQHHRYLAQNAEIMELKKDLAEAHRHIGRHERFFNNLRDLFCYRVDDTLRTVVDFLVERFGFKPPPPPR